MENKNVNQIKETIEKIENEFENSSIGHILKIGREATIIDETYKGRYLYELIQNARDAGIEAKKEDSNFKINIKILLTEKELKIANRGTNFNNKAIFAITSIGKTTKNKPEFIGHKGIGFISVLDITEKPKIITKNSGTILFDKSKVFEKMNEFMKSGKLREPADEDDKKAFTKKENMPLFDFPIFENKNIEDNEDGESFKDYDTLIVLPLKEDKKFNDVKEYIEKILVVENFVFFSEIDEIELYIRTNPLEKEILLKKLNINRKKNNEVIIKTKTEEHKFLIFKDIEKSHYNNNLTLKTDIAVKLNKNGKITFEDNAKLYLYYPTEVNSGFKFLINGMFEVDPSRQYLRPESKINEKILDRVKYLINDELISFITNPKNDNYIDKKEDIYKLFYFEDSHNELIEKLHNSLRNTLKDKKFFYNPKTGSYFSPSNVILVDDENIIKTFGIYYGSKLLIDNSINNNLLEYWFEGLNNNNSFNMDFVLKHIEDFLEEKYKNKKFNEILNVYKYLIQNHEKFRLEYYRNPKKIFLSQNGKFLSTNKKTIFYHKNNNIHLYESIEKEVAFLSNNIVKLTENFNISNLHILGIENFSESSFIDSLIELYKKYPATLDLQEYLSKVIIQLNIYDKEDKDILNKIKNFIYLPIKNRDKWLSLKDNIVYIQDDSNNLPDWFLKDKIVLDFETFLKESKQNDKKNIKEFLVEATLYDKPAITDESIDEPEDKDENILYKYITFITKKINLYKEDKQKIVKEYIKERIYELIKNRNNEEKYNLYKILSKVIDDTEEIEDKNIFLLQDETFANIKDKDIFIPSKDFGASIDKNIKEKISFINFEIAELIHANDSKNNFIDFIKLGLKLIDNRNTFIDKLVKILNEEESEIKQEEIFKNILKMEGFFYLYENLDIKHKFIPIQNREEWIKLDNSKIVYFEKEEFKIFDNREFLNLHVFKEEIKITSTNKENIEKKINEFLEYIGVWNKPAIYNNNDDVDLPKDSKDNKIFIELLRGSWDKYNENEKNVIKKLKEKEIINNLLCVNDITPTKNFEFFDNFLDINLQKNQSFINDLNITHQYLNKEKFIEKLLNNFKEWYKYRYILECKKEYENLLNYLFIRSYKINDLDFNKLKELEFLKEDKYQSVTFIKAQDLIYIDNQNMYNLLPNEAQELLNCFYIPSKDFNELFKQIGKNLSRICSIEVEK